MIYNLNLSIYKLNTQYIKTHIQTQIQRINKLYHKLQYTNSGLQHIDTQTEIHNKN